jgi:toxin secretion/phage lysis holin
MKAQAFSVIKWVACLLAAQWMGVSVPMQNVLICLTMLMAIDYFSGLVCAVITQTLSSRVGLIGLCKKVLILCLVLMTHLLEKAMSVELHLEMGCAMAFCVNESLSIVENSAKAGIPIPEKLSKLLAALKDKEDE